MGLGPVLLFHQIQLDIIKNNHQQNKFRQLLVSSRDQYRSVQRKVINVINTAKAAAAICLLLEAVLVKAIGELDGPVTTLPLGAEALRADGVEIAP